MPLFQKILCPVDMSTFSGRALRYATELGRRHDAGVVTLLVRPPVESATQWLTRASALPLETAETRAEAVEALGGFVRSVVGDAPTRVVVADGQIVPEILRVARELPADLIVMGTHGRGGFERLLLGSVTEKTLRKAECPVLTIPGAAAGEPDTPDAAFGTIVCGVDRSVASRRALGHALSLAEEGGGRLVIVHVLEDFANEEPAFARHFNTPACWTEVEPEIRAAYEALVPDAARSRTEVSLPRGRAHRELLRIARERGAGLIVLGAAGWHAPFGATTQHVLRSADCPVLVAPAGDAAP